MRERESESELGGGGGGGWGEVRGQCTPDEPARVTWPLSGFGFDALAVRSRPLEAACEASDFPQFTESTVTRVAHSKQRLYRRRPSCLTFER